MVHTKIIYTAVFGNRNYLPHLEIIPDDWDFVYFTDNDNISSGLWRIIYTRGSHSDPRRSSRYLKLQPHILFPDHDISVWVDGNFNLPIDLNRLDIMDTYDFVGLKHPHIVHGIYHEGERCILYEKDDPEIINEQLNRYRNDNIPEKCDIIATGMLIRRHNLRHIIDFDNMWFEELKKGSKRDQISFPYVAMKLNLKYGKIEFGIFKK